MINLPKPGTDPLIADEAPGVQELTDYDRRLFICYMRLLDAEAEGANWREIVRIVLQIDPETEYERAKRAYDTHIARARWIAEHGFHHLLEKADDE